MHKPRAVRTPLGIRSQEGDCGYESKGDHWTLFIGLPMGYDEIPNEYLLPAWSLHRLMYLVFNNGGVRVELYEDDDAYEVLIYHIEWLIKEGYFNKEYLV